MALTSALNIAALPTWSTLNIFNATLTGNCASNAFSYSCFAFTPPPLLAPSNSINLLTPAGVLLFSKNFPKDKIALASPKGSPIIKPGSKRQGAEKKHEVEARELYEYFLEVLCGMTMLNDLSVSSRAIEFLGNFPNEPRALKELLRTADDMIDIGMLSTAARSLGAFPNEPRALEALLKLAKHLDKSVRESAAESLGKFSNDPRALEDLLELAKDSKDSVRRAAAESLVKFIYDPRALEILLEMTKDSAPDVRSAAARSLGAFPNDPRTLEALLEMAKDSDTQVRYAAVQSLGKFSNDPRALEALLEMAKDSAPDVRYVAVQSLGEFPNDPRALEAALEMANDRSDYWRTIAAIQALGEFPNDPRALEALLEMAKHRNPHLMDWITNSLGKFPNEPRVLEALLEMTKGLFWSNVVVESLGKFTNDPRALEALLDMVNDKLPLRIRQTAVKFLGNFPDDPRALEAALEMAKDSAPDVRYVAVQSLGVFPNEPRALEALVEIAKDINPQVLNAAIKSWYRNHEERLRSLEIPEFPEHTDHLSVIIEAVLAIQKIFQVRDANSARAPHPAQTLAAKIRAVVSKLRKEKPKVVRGFQNRGIHPGRRPDSTGFDFREYRDIKPGQAVDMRNVRYVGGEYRERVYQQTQAIDNMIVVDPNVLRVEHTTSTEIIVGLIAEMNLNQRDRVGILIGDGKHGRYMKPTQKRYATENILKAMMMGSASQASAPEGGIVRLLEQNLLRQQLPHGSQVYLVADFAREQNLEGVGRIIENFSRRGVTVVPVQVGRGKVLIPRPVVRIGTHRYEVHVDPNDIKAAKNRQQDVASLLAKYKGAVVIDEGHDAETKTISEIAKQLGQTPKADQIKLDAEFSGEDIFEIDETTPPPDLLKKLKKTVEDKSFGDLLFLVKTAKMRGWTVVLNWVEAMAFSEKPYWFVGEYWNRNSTDPDIYRMYEKAVSETNSDAHWMRDMESWGPSDPQIERALYVANAELEARQQIIKDEPSQPALGMKGMLHSAARYFGADSGKSVEESVAIAKNAKASLSGTGAMHQEEPGKSQIWLRLNKNLKGAQSYLALGLYGKFDPAHGTYTEVPGFTIDDIAGFGGKTVKGVLTDAADVVDVPVPLGAKLSGKKGNRVSFTLSQSQTDVDIMNMKLSEFRRQAPSAYGDQYDLLTETVPLESMPKDIQALIKGIDDMTVRDAMRAIQRFMVENFEYRQFDEITEKPLHEELQARAARGELTGPNEFLDFILQMRAGHCQEISEMTMALLRLSGIPTVKFIGYQADGKQVDREAHASAIALLPSKNGTWHAEPVEGSWKYIKPEEASEIMITELPFASADYKMTEPADKSAPQKTDRQNDVSDTAYASDETPVKAKPNMHNLEQRWQDRWDRATESQKREMSKAFEYYVHLLMYRGMRFGTSQVTELLLNADQYRRFKPSIVKPPSYWLAQVRSFGVTLADLNHFQQILNQKMSSD